MKRVKAWAVVDKDGRLHESFADLFICATKSCAEEYVSPLDAQRGERVVPVTIVVEEK